MTTIDELLQRIERLENAVFNKDCTENNQAVLNLDANFENIVSEINDHLQNLKPHFEENDSIIFQAVLHNKDDIGNYNLTSLFTVDKEEDDAEIESLCKVLASKQRISILRHLSKNQYSSGELVELTQMAGGHLHHHLKELLFHKFIFTTDTGKYSATKLGVDTYLTIAALNRKLNYDYR